MNFNKGDVVSFVGRDGVTVGKIIKPGKKRDYHVRFHNGKTKLNWEFNCSELTLITKDDYYTIKNKNNSSIQSIIEVCLIKKCLDNFPESKDYKNWIKVHSSINEEQKLKLSIYRCETTVGPLSAFVYKKLEENTIVDIDVRFKRDIFEQIQEEQIA